MNLKKGSASFLIVHKLVHIFLFGTIFFSCKNSDVPLPEGYLTQQEMVPIVVDIHLIEGARSGTLILGDTNKLPDYYAKIYEKYNISEVKFKESFGWYAQNPEKLKTIYEEVIVELSKKEVEITARKKPKSEYEVTEITSDSSKVMPVDSLKK